MIETQRLFQELQRMGAGEFVHLNGSLEEHLIGTAALLQEWNAPEHLRVAGLFHAAYGTAGFEGALACAEERHKVAALIGAKSERLVYLYCCCDRQKFYPVIGTEHEHRLPDRFASVERELTSEELDALCELTAANELEIASKSAAFRNQYGRSLAELFRRMRRHLSAHARTKVAEVFANEASSATLLALTGSQHK